MDEQVIRVLVEHGDEWLDVGEFLKEHIATLVPMSVGQCFRFRMPAAVDVEPRRTLHDAFLVAELHGTASVVVSATEGILLILPKPVQVDVTFEGDAVLRTTGLGIVVKARPKRRKRKPAPTPTADDPWAWAAKMLDKGELKLEPYQERIAKLFEDKTAGVTLKQRRQSHRAQLHVYAKMRAVPNCGFCHGGGIIQQQQIADDPIEEFCECVLETP